MCFVFKPIVKTNYKLKIKLKRYISSCSVCYVNFKHRMNMNVDFNRSPNIVGNIHSTHVHPKHGEKMKRLFYFLFPLWNKLIFNHTKVLSNA